MSNTKKPDFNGANIPELLGITPICLIKDEELWTHLVTPQVKAFLGDIQSSQISVRETTDGDFGGDEVTNYNDHRLYGGKQGFVRFPYINAFYKTTYGALIIKRDGTKFKILAYFGRVEKGEGELLFKVAMRDRRYDGTLRANDCSLVDFPGYELAQYNHTLNIPNMPENSTGVELSIYGFMPGSRLVDALGEPEYEAFVKNPFSFLDRPELYLQYFKRAWNTKRAPGQFGNPVPDVSKWITPMTDMIAIKAGYDYIENCSSHFHVAKWAESVGYRYSDPKQAETLAAFTDGIKKLLASGMKLTRQQQSWVVAIQSLRKDMIPAGLDLGGPIWPQDNVGPENLWMYKPLSDRAKAALAATLATATAAPKPADAIVVATKSDAAGSASGDAAAKSVVDAGSAGNAGDTGAAKTGDTASVKQAKTAGSGEAVTTQTGAGENALKQDAGAQTAAKLADDAGSKDGANKGAK
jgi:hypothetical protein